MCVRHVCLFSFDAELVKTLNVNSLVVFFTLLPCGGGGKHREDPERRRVEHYWTQMFDRVTFWAAANFIIGILIDSFVEA